MPTSVHTFATNEVSIKFLDDVTSLGVNQRLEGMLRPGVYRGFAMHPGSVDMSITFALDSAVGDHVALVPMGDKSVGVHSYEVFGDIDLTTYASTRCHLVLTATDDPSTTTGTLEILSDAELNGLAADKLLVLGSVNVPASGALSHYEFEYQRVLYGGRGDGPWTKAVDLTGTPVTSSVKLGDAVGGDSGSHQFELVAAYNGWAYTADNAINARNDDGTAIIGSTSAGESVSVTLARKVSWPFQDDDGVISFEADVEWLSADTGKVTLVAASDNGVTGFEHSFSPGDPAITLELASTPDDFIFGSGDGPGTTLASLALLWELDSTPLGVEDVLQITAIRVRGIVPGHSDKKDFDKGVASGVNALNAVGDPLHEGSLVNVNEYTALISGDLTTSNLGATGNDRAAVLAVRWLAAIIAESQSGPSMGVGMGVTPSDDGSPGGANLLHDTDRAVLTSSIGVDESLNPHRYKVSATPPTRPAALAVDSGVANHPVRLLRKPGTVSNDDWNYADFEEAAIGTKAYDVVIAQDDSYDTGDLFMTDLTPLFDGTLFGDTHTSVLLMPGTYTATEVSETQFGIRPFTIHGRGRGTVAAAQEETRINITMFSATSEIARVTNGGLWLANIEVYITAGGSFIQGDNLGATGDAARLRLDDCVINADDIYLKDINARAQRTEFIGSTLIENNPLVVAGSNNEKSNYSGCTFHKLDSGGRALATSGAEGTRGADILDCLVYSQQSGGLLIEGPAHFRGGVVYLDEFASAGAVALSMEAGDAVIEGLRVIDDRAAATQSSAILTAGQVKDVEVLTHLGQTDGVTIEMDETDPTSLVDGLTIRCRCDGSAVGDVWALSGEAGISTVVRNISIVMEQSAAGTMCQYADLGTGRWESIVVSHHTDSSTFVSPDTKTSDHFSLMSVSADIHGLDIRGYPKSEAVGAGDWDILTHTGGYITGLRILGDSGHDNDANLPRRAIHASGDSRYGTVSLEHVYTDSNTVYLLGAGSDVLGTGGDFNLLNCRPQSGALSSYAIRSLGAIGSYRSSGKSAPVQLHDASSVHLDVDTTVAWSYAGTEAWIDLDGAVGVAKYQGTFPNNTVGAAHQGVRLRVGAAIGVLDLDVDGEGSSLSTYPLVRMENSAAALAAVGISVGVLNVAVKNVDFAHDYQMISLYRGKITVGTITTLIEAVTPAAAGNPPSNYPELLMNVAGAEDVIIIDQMLSHQSPTSGNLTYVSMDVKKATGTQDGVILIKCYSVDFAESPPSVGRHNTTWPTPVFGISDT